jgi:hypothetical protein
LALIVDLPLLLLLRVFEALTVLAVDDDIDAVDAALAATGELSAAAASASNP